MIFNNYDKLDWSVTWSVTLSRDKIFWKSLTLYQTGSVWSYFGIFKRDNMHHCSSRGCKIAGGQNMRSKQNKVDSLFTMSTLCSATFLIFFFSDLQIRPLVVLQPFELLTYQTFVAGIAICIFVKHTWY